MKIKLTKAEVNKLKKLSREAQSAPVMAVTSEAFLSGRTFSAIAREAVNDYWKVLSKKYKFKFSDFKGIDEKKCILHLK